MNSSDNQLSTLLSTANKVGEEFLSANDLQAKLNVIFEYFMILRTELFQLVGNAYNQHTYQKETKGTYGLNYHFAISGKKYLTNIRNLAFEMQKANASIDPREDYLEEVNEYFKRNTLFLVEESRKLDKLQMKALKYQKNPWPTIKSQIEVLEDQILDMKKNDSLFPELSMGFNSIREGFLNAIESSKMAIASNLELAVLYLQKVRNDLQDFANIESPHNHKEFTRLDLQLEKLPVESSIAIALEGNRLVKKPINFRMVTKEWLESEISPMYYEIIELAEEARDELRMIKVNLLNSLHEENDESNKEVYKFSQKEIEAMLEGYILKNRQNLQTVVSLAKPLTMQLMEHLLVAKIFNPQSQFFTITGVRYKNKVKSAGGSFRKTAKRFFIKRMVPLFDELFAEESADKRSLGEKLVEVTQFRSSIPYNYYSSIFLTKGLSGEGFWVKRPYHEEKVSNIYRKWKQGYRGSILVTGRRHSGKSIFMEMLAREYFERKIIRISPDSKFEIDGRPFETTTSLEDVLQFIENNSPTSKSLFMIDDLELWQSAGESLGRTLQLLIRHIDKYSSRNFYLVSMSLYGFQHFNKYFKLERAFQDVLDLSKTRHDVLTEIIARRHYSTHVTLFDEELEEVGAAQLKTLTREIYDLVEGNIGDALVLWTMMNQPNSEGKVINQLKKWPRLPDFLKPESTVVLDFLHLHKRSNEYHFRKAIGPSFSTKYDSVLNRLMHVGLIKRLPDGKLEINEYLVNDVEKHLTDLNG